MTAYPPERVAAVLEPLRAYTDEIVIAIDATVDESTIPQYKAIADQVHRIEYLLVERHLGWLHAQCRGDWILKLDGDEIPSSAFVRKLPELLEARQVMQYWVARSWLYPDRTRVLDELPWSADFNNRLVRNLGTLWFEGTLHAHASPIFPTAYVEEPIYHLELLEEDETARRAKAVRYEINRPHLIAHGGGRLNEAFYLPELRSELHTRGVPPEDQVALGRVPHCSVASRSSRAPSSTHTRHESSDPPVTPLAELDRYWAGRSFPPSTYAARIELYAGIERLVPEQADSVFVRVVNLGTERFPGLPQRDPPIRLAYRWLHPDGAVHIADGVRTFLPCPLEPGAEAVVPVTVIAPATGGYVLELDLVHEGVRWFDCALRIGVQVGGPEKLPAVGPRLGITSGGRLRRLGRRRIPRILHRVRLGAAAADLPEDLDAGWDGSRGAWEIRTWTDADLLSLGLGEAQVRSAIGRDAELSNVVRFEVLRRHGGVCAEVGVQSRRPIDSILRGLSAFAVLERPGRVGTAVLGCVPDHPAFVRAAQEAPLALLRAADPAAADGSYFLSLILEQERDVAILGPDNFRR